jgi:hypothetical protein
MRRFAAGAIALALLAPASAAVAAQPGVYVDPSSPAAKEYTLPLASGRSVDGGSPSAAQQAQEPPLFGQGITPAGETAAALASGARGGVSSSSVGVGAHGRGSSGARGTSASRAFKYLSHHRAKGVGATAALGGGSSARSKPAATLTNLAQIRGASATASELYLVVLVLALGGLFGAGHALASRRRGQPRS